MNDLLLKEFYPAAGNARSSALLLSLFSLPPTHSSLHCTVHIILLVSLSRSRERGLRFSIYSIKEEKERKKSRKSAGDVFSPGDVMVMIMLLHI